MEHRHVVGAIEHEQSRPWNQIAQFIAGRDRHDRVPLAPDEQRWRLDRLKLAPNLLHEQITRRTQQRGWPGAERVIAECREEAWRETQRLIHQWRDLAEDGVAAK